MAVTRAYKNATNFQERTTATPLIINGDMQIAQRGTSFSPSGSVQNYTIDRFKYHATSSFTGDATITQSTDSPTGTGFTNSLKITPDATETPTGSMNAVFSYSFEGQNVQILQHGATSPESVTLSFWVKSNKTGTYCVQIKEEGITGESYVLFEYTINSSNTWEKKVISWTGNSAHTINNDNTEGYRIVWHLATGSDDHVSATTSWTVDTAFKATSNQVNFFDSTSNEWYITGVQLEVGSFDANSIPPFQFEDVGTSLARCQRYFYNPLQGTTDAYGVFGQVVCLSSTRARGILYSPSVMRTLPTIVTSGDLEVAGDSFTIGVSSITTSGRTGTQAMEFTYDVSSGLTSGDGAIVRRRNDADATFQLDAEL